MTEQWQELKETITEMRDNGGTGTQQEVCKFLANYMEILEKQMQQPCEDCINRKEVNVLVDELARAISDERCFMSRGRSTANIMQDILDLPSVTPTRPIGKWIDVGDEGLVFECSICGNKNTIESHFCPSCGAKVREGEEWQKID